MTQAALDLSAKPGWTPPVFPSPSVVAQEVKDILEQFIDAGKRTWVPGPTNPIEVIEVSSFAQLPVILERLEQSGDTVRLVFPTMLSTGDPAKDTRIADEQTAIRDLMSQRHAKPIGDLITEAFSKIEDSYLFDDLRTSTADFQEILRWWKDNDNRWKLNAASQVKLQVAEVVDLSTGENEAEKDALRDLLVKGVQNPTTPDRFVCILPNNEREAKELGQKVLDGIAAATMTSPVNLESIPVWVCANVVWDRMSRPSGSVGITPMDLKELQRRIGANEKIVTGAASQGFSGERGGFFRRAADWLWADGWN
jgi:hypothetical protein